ncbi:uncharacterized protein METZ01_LOCUS50653 [marine metagenome]|uniref:Uncharacterized protein n=1 Tax=marine metagenome TaxID=408172 RepID=A0A381S2Y6_9ZZZZ
MGRFIAEINFAEIKPFIISTNKTPAAKAAPWVRNAFVPPALPLPKFRMSTPFNFPRRTLPEVEPIR